MQECRDIARVTAKIKAALHTGGWFIISDFPFPEDDETLRTAAGRILCGV
jgi:hypothetical protein